MKQPPINETALVDAEKLLSTFTHALAAGSPEQPYADYFALLWGFELNEVFGAGAKVIAAFQITIAQQEQQLLALEARVADLEQSVGRRQPYGTRMVGDIVQWVAAEMNLRVTDIRGEGRHSVLLAARQVIAWCARRIIPDCSYVKIGKAIGGRDHSTIINAERHADMRRNVDAEFREICDRLVAAFTTDDRIARAFPDEEPPHGNRPRR